MAQPMTTTVGIAASNPYSSFAITGEPDSPLCEHGHATGQRRGRRRGGGGETGSLLHGLDDVFCR